MDYLPKNKLPKKCPKINPAYKYLELVGSLDSRAFAGGPTTTTDCKITPAVMFGTVGDGLDWKVGLNATGAKSVGLTTAS